MSNEFSMIVVNIIGAAWDEADKRGHNPILGHRPKNEGTGRPFFFTEDPIPWIMRAIIDGAEYTMKKGECITIKVFMPKPMGKTTYCPPQEDSTYTLRGSIHGSLQAVGPAEITSVTTNVVTLVITKEKGDIWMLAECFPGEKEPRPNISGLDAGDKLTGRQLIERGFTRVVCE